MEQISDSVLVEKVKKGDKNAYRMLFDRYKPLLLLEAYYTVGDTELARKIVERVFLEIWDVRASLNSHDFFDCLKRSLHAQRQSFLN